jgi:hypothetical protein
MARCVILLCALLAGCAFNVSPDTVCHWRIKAIKCKSAF